MLQFKFQIKSLKEGNYQTWLEFKNEEIKEYVYYLVNYTVTD